jgi:hypothetical protein
MIEQKKKQKAPSQVRKYWREQKAKQRKQKEQEKTLSSLMAILFLKMIWKKSHGLLIH